MNVTDVNIVHQNCTNRIIHNMGDVISKENINETKYMKMPENHIKTPIIDNADKTECSPLLEKIKSAMDSIDTEGSKSDANIDVNEKVSEGVGIVETISASMKRAFNKRCENTCCTDSDDSDERHHILVTELQSIIQGLYEAKLNDLKVLLCTCCNTSTLSPFEKPEDLYLEDAMESDNDSDDCSSCDTCEATFKETSSKSQCGCTDPSGFPHHVQRNLRNPKCIDARVVYLVDRLYEMDPHTLFLKLDFQIENIISNLYKHLETFMKNHNNDTKHSQLFIVLILECYQNLCSATKRVAPILRQLEKGHMSRFSLTWDLLNRSIYMENIHVKLQPYVLEVISQGRKTHSGVKIYSEDLVQRYIKLDGEMTLISAMWYDVCAMIKDYNIHQYVPEVRSKKLDNHYQALLVNLESQNKKLKIQKVKRSNSEPVGIQSQNTSSTNSTNSINSKSSSDTIPSHNSPSKSCTYSENCQCFAPELCISEEVIRVLNKETDGAVDSTNIKASSTPRGDLVCLPGGDIKKNINKQIAENKPLLSKDASKVLSNLKLDSSGNLQTSDPKKKFVMLPEKFPCPCKGDLLDCKHRKALQKIPIHSPTCKSGLNSLTNGASSAPTTVQNAKTDQTSTCPKHGKRKLYTPDWDSKTSITSSNNEKAEVSDSSKQHTHGHNCCGGEGDGHVHWTPNSHNKGCACCYCSVYDGVPPNTCSPVNRKYNEARERLRGKLNKTKAMNKAAAKTTNAQVTLNTKTLEFITNRDESRDSSCTNSKEMRNVDQLIEWIEGASNKQQKDPAKKAEKKARQKLKKLADKDKDDQSVITPTQTPEPKQMYVVPEPLKPKAMNCNDGMVNIRLLTSDVPRVAVTAVGSSPDKNKLLYTLINGQKIIPEPEISKKKKKKDKQNICASVTNTEINIVEDVKSKIKQKKNEKHNQLSTDNISKKTDNKLVKSNNKKDSKTSNKSNKDSATDVDKSENDSKQKLSKTNIGKVPKCQDKFCQTDDHLSYSNEITISPSKPNDSEKKNNKKEKKQKDKQPLKISAAITKQQTSNANSSDKVNENKKNKNKGTINVKSEKNKLNENVSNTLNKSDVDLNSSQEWIEINNKSRANHNSKVNTVSVDNNNTKNAKTKKNKNKQDHNQGVSKTLNKAFGNLNLAKDTTIEVTRENMAKLSIANTGGKKASNSKNNATNFLTNSKKAAPLGKCNEYSIMDQLNQGVGVERLKLPPGITLTKVDAVTAYASQQRKTQQAVSKSSGSSNAPKNQEFAMIIANPAQTSVETGNDKCNEAPPANAASSTKSTRKSRRKNKNRAINPEDNPTVTETKQPKMITLRNPLFQNNMLKLNSNTAEQYNGIQTELPYNPIPMPKQASITQNKDGMFTIRSPALQHAMSTGATNFKPHPYAEFPMQDHFSYFSNAESNHHDTNYQNDNANLAGTNSFQTQNSHFSESVVSRDGLSYSTSIQNGDISDKNDSGYRNYSSFGDLHSPNSGFVSARDENFSYFSQSSQDTIHSGIHTDTDNSRSVSSSMSDNMNQYPFSQSYSHNYLSSQNVQRLNSQVTIHNISESMYKPNSQEPQENDYKVEITKMPNIQQTYGKYGNIGEELTLTRSNAINNSMDHQPFQLANCVNGLINTKARKDSELVDNIFAPNQMVNLSELESEERDIESFKRFDYYFEPPKHKPKINLNVNDIVVKKKPSSASESGANFGDYVPNLQKYQINNCLQKKF